MPVGGVSLLGECHEPGSEGTELMGNIAGARLVAQTERCRWRSRSTVGAQTERGWSAVGGTVGARMVAQMERG